MSKKTISKAVTIAGSQAALANGIRLNMPPGCKIIQANISQWINLKKIRCKVPPAEYVLPISKTVKWYVTQHGLRPDLS